MTISLPLRRGSTGWWVLLTRLRFWRQARDEGDEAQLVAAAKYGDPDAFDALVERYAPQLHAVARRMVGDDLAADVVQDGLLAAFKSLRNYRGAASFSTYLHTIVINRCRRLGPKQPQHLPLREVAGNRPGPHEVLEPTSPASRSTAPFGRSPTSSGRHWGCSEYSGLSYSEIAEVLGLQEGTVKSRIARARRLLKAALESAGVRP